MIQINDFSSWKKQAGIYGIKNTVNDKWYVGSGGCNGRRNVGKRVWEHIRLLARQVHCNRHLQSAWNKYGSKVFAYFVLELTENNDDVLFERESYWTNELNAIKNGYNISQDPRFVCVPYTEERKQKVGELSRQRWLDAEYKQYMSTLAKERMAKPEYKAIAKKTIEKLWSNPVEKEKLVASMQGLTRTEEHKLNLSKSKQGKPNYKLRGKPLSAKHCQKISERMQGNKYSVGRVLSEATRKKLVKPIKANITQLQKSD